MNNHKNKKQITQHTYAYYSRNRSLHTHLLYFSARFSNWFWQFCAFLLLLSLFAYVISQCSTQHAHYSIFYFSFLFNIRFGFEFSFPLMTLWSFFYSYVHWIKKKFYCENLLLRKITIKNTLCNIWPKPVCGFCQRVFVIFFCLFFLVQID